MEKVILLADKNSNAWDFAKKIQRYLKDKEERFWGISSLLGIVAFLGDTFSFDSFAIPNPWILFGLITAALAVFTKSKNQDEESLT